MVEIVEIRCEVEVGLKANAATIKRTSELFSGPAQRFIIESDRHGFSAVERRKDGYYHINMLEGKTIRDEKLDESKAEKIIKEVLEERHCGK